MEFAYNRALSVTMGHFLFEVVYELNSLIPIELTSLPIDLQVYNDAQRNFMRASKVKLRKQMRYIRKEPINI